jgi:pyruvate carboxylase
MKMEMIVQAPMSGKVKKLYVSNGTKLEGDDLILLIE